MTEAAEKTEDDRLTQTAINLIPDATIEQKRHVVALLLGFGLTSPATAAAAPLPPPRKRQQKRTPNRNGLSATVLAFVKTRPDGVEPVTINSELKAAGKIAVSMTDQDILNVLTKNPNQYRKNSATGLWQYVRVPVRRVA